MQKKNKNCTISVLINYRSNKQVTTLAATKNIAQSSSKTRDVATKPTKSIKTPKKDRQSIFP